MSWSEEANKDKGENLSFMLFLLLIGALGSWWAISRLSALSGLERTLFFNRFVLCSVVYGVFVSYYSWRTLKPDAWQLKDRDNYAHPSTLDLPDSWSPNMKRYKRKAKLKKAMRRRSEENS